MTSLNAILPASGPYDHYQGNLQGPVSGIYVPVPAFSDAGGPLAIDIRNQFMPTRSYRLTCEITPEQAASSDPREGIYYVFVKDPADGMVGLPDDFQYDMTRNVPDIIGIGFSVREVSPMGTPFLLLLSRTELQAEVRLRVA